MNSLNSHPISQDESVQDYIVPAYRYEEEEGKFRILGEEQDNWYCFLKSDNLGRYSPVYFESCLNIEKDYGIDKRLIVNGDSARISNSFTEFLWQLIGMRICLRDTNADYFKDEVCGISIDRQDLKLKPDFSVPENCQFPYYICHFSDSAICVPEYSAAFKNKSIMDRFINEYGIESFAVWP